MSPVRTNLNDVWGTSDTDVWAVGAAATVLHWDGTTWSKLKVPLLAVDLTAVSGVAPNDVWVGGASGALLHWDGSSWAVVPVPAAAGISDIWASGAGDAWVTADGGVLRCSPSGCQEVAGPREPFKPFRVQGTAASDVYFLEGNTIARLSSGAWSYPSGGPGPWIKAFDFQVVNPNDISVAIFDRLPGGFITINGILHWDGAAWNATINDQTNAYLPVDGIWVSPTESWSVGVGGRIHHWDGSKDVNLETAGPSGLVRILEDIDSNGAFKLSLSALWTDQSGIAWSSSTYRYEILDTWAEDEFSVNRGESRILTRPRHYPGAVPLGIHGSSPSNVWFTDISGVYRWNGSQISQQLALTPSDYNAPDYTGPLWAFSEKDVWFAGRRGLHHFDGSRFSDLDLDASISAIWASWSHDLWAVGEQDGKPAAFHLDGSEWEKVALPERADDAGALVSLAPHCTNDFYAIGTRGKVFHWNGTIFETVVMPIPLAAMTGGGRVGAELWVTGLLPDATVGCHPCENNTPVVIRHAW